MKLNLTDIDITFDELFEEFDERHDWLTYAVKPSTSGGIPLPKSDLRLNVNVSPALYDYKIQEMKTIVDRLFHMAYASGDASKYSIALSCSHILYECTLDIDDDLYLGEPEFDDAFDGYTCESYDNEVR